MTFLQWICENWGVVCVWIGILVNSAGLVYNLCKLLRTGGFRRAQNWIAVREAARRFECEAEELTHLRGGEKLQYVLCRLNEYMAELGEHFSEEELMAAVEADIAFSKEVNATKSEELE